MANVHVGRWLIPAREICGEMPEECVVIPNCPDRDYPPGVQRVLTLAVLPTAYCAESKCHTDYAPILCEWWLIEGTYKEVKRTPYEE